MRDPGAELQEESFFVNITQNESGISKTEVPTDPSFVSPYKSQFTNGATLFPRPYVFVTDDKKGESATVSTIPKYDETASKRYRKKEWMVMKNETVPSQFLFDCVQGDCIEPYELTHTKRVLLPIAPQEDSYQYIADAVESGDGYRLKKDIQTLLPESTASYTLSKKLEDRLFDLLNRIEQDWEDMRGEKFDIKGSKTQRMSILDRFNYQGSLLKQRNHYDCAVVYNKSGQRPRAAVVENKSPIIENKCYYSYFESIEEAYFVCAILNSDYVISSLEELGILSARDIDTKPFELPIPEYSSENNMHTELANEAMNEPRNYDRIEELVKETLTKTVNTLK